MHKKTRIILSVSIISSLYMPTLDAATLTPPSLQTVIKQNIEWQKTLPNITKPTSQNTVQSDNNADFKKKITYKTIEKGNAITLKRANEENLWIQEIHLDKWAHLSSILVSSGYDSIEKWGEPLFKKLTLTEMRNSLPEAPFSIINGQFFDPGIQPTRLSFGLITDSVLRTVGADNGTSSKNILFIKGNQAKIIPYTSWTDLRDSSAELGVVGLSLSSAYYKHENIGRTYICIKNPDENNSGNTLLIFTAESMSEYNLENEMMRQGCTRNTSIKMDASGSSRLWYNGEFIFGVSRSGSPDKRTIPHGIAIYDAKN